jgi:hypothetical protein
VIAAFAAIVAFACAAASARRMWLASNATAWHPEVLLALLGKRPDGEAVARLREAAEKDARADWERDFLAAVSSPDEHVRAALVNEQLSELDYRIQRWASVPRICARITTSFAFLLAAVVLRNGLADTTDFSEPTMRALIGDGLTVVFMGFVGTSFCIAANRQARTAARARLAAADALVERLEALAMEG